LRIHTSVKAFRLDGTFKFKRLWIEFNWTLLTVLYIPCCCCHSRH
jgi:hypothetical protein